MTVVDTPAVDRNVLADLGRLSRDPTFIERLLRGFRSDTEHLVKTISDGLAARRYEDVKDAAHALKGGAGSVGATQLVQLAMRFEKASHDTAAPQGGGVDRGARASLPPSLSPPSKRISRSGGGPHAAATRRAARNLHDRS